MKDADQKRAGTAFVKRWQDRGNEWQAAKFLGWLAGDCPWYSQSRRVHQFWRTCNVWIIPALLTVSSTQLRAWLNRTVAISVSLTAYVSLTAVYCPHLSKQNDIPLICHTLNDRAGSSQVTLSSSSFTIWSNLTANQQWSSLRTFVLSLISWTRISIKRWKFRCKPVSWSVRFTMNFSRNIVILLLLAVSAVLTTCLCG